MIFPFAPSLPADQSANELSISRLAYPWQLADEQETGGIHRILGPTQINFDELQWHIELPSINSQENGPLRGNWIEGCFLPSRK